MRMKNVERPHCIHRGWLINNLDNTTVLIRQTPLRQSKKQSTEKVRVIEDSTIFHFLLPQVAQTFLYQFNFILCIRFLLPFNLNHFRFCIIHKFLVA